MGVSSFLRSRFSGSFEEDINSTKRCLVVIGGLSLSDSNWLSWYESSLHHSLDILKKGRFIPLKFLKHFITYNNQRSLNEIIQNGIYVIKDICLPTITDSVDASPVFNMIADSLLPYLFDGIDEEILYSIIPPFMEGPYEYKAVRIAKGDIVIDAGANIGEFSALAGHKGCRAFAFEPMPGIIDKYLSKTARMNPNITICPYALSDRRGELIFYEDLQSMSSASLLKRNKKINAIKVDAIDLDSYVNQSNLPKVDFIKADIEGAERYMLMGAKNVLKEYAPKIAVCTYHLPDDPRVLRELILDANPRYIVEERFKKMYAHVPK